MRLGAGGLPLGAARGDQNPSVASRALCGNRNGLIVDAFVWLRRFERSESGRTFRVIVDLAHIRATNLVAGNLSGGDLRARLPHADVQRYERASHLVLEDAPYRLLRYRGRDELFNGTDRDEVTPMLLARLDEATGGRRPWARSSHRL